MPPQIWVPETILQVTLARLPFLASSFLRLQVSAYIEPRVICRTPLFYFVSAHLHTISPALGTETEEERDTWLTLIRTEAKMCRDGLRDWGPSGDKDRESDTGKNA